MLHDHDEHGRRARDAALQALDGIAASVFAVDLPGVEEVDRAGEDVSDWLAQGGTRRQLGRLIGEALR